MNHYKKYVGQYVKRFYTPFLKDNIFRINDFRINPRNNVAEFLYADDDRQKYWTDVDDSVIITNELPIVSDERIANVNSKEYRGYNPFD